MSARDARRSACARRPSSPAACASSSSTSARASERDEFHYEGGIRDFVALRERGEGPGPQAHRLLRGRERAGRRRGRDAVEHVVRRVGLLVREQHQHARGRLAPVRLQGGAHAHAEPVRARQGPSEGEGGQPRGRGRARGARRGHLGEAPRPAVRGADEDEARQPLGARASSSRRSTQKLAEFLEENPTDAHADHPEGDLGRARAAGRPQGARAHAAQERAREPSLPGKLADCQIRRPELGRALPRRGQLGRRLREDARDRSFQAILPLRGKVINSEKNRINKVLSNTEIQAMVTAIGTGIGEEFDIAKLRYHR